MFLSCQVSILSNSIKMRYYSKYCRDSSFQAYFNYFKNQRLSVQNVFSVKIRFDQNQFKFHTRLPSRTSTISNIKGCVQNVFSLKIYASTKINSNLSLNSIPSVKFHIQQKQHVAKGIIDIVYTYISKRKVSESCRGKIVADEC